MTLRFGTDGVRGVAGTELSAALTLALGRAAAEVLREPGANLFVVGRDTRRSGPMLQAALAAGLMSRGVDVVDLGVLPTPAVAALAAEMNCAGAVISASHNPYADNGIKLFARGGKKLDSDTEALIESLMISFEGGPEPSGAELGLAQDDPGGADRYLSGLAGVLEHRDLGGLRVVVDCGNGAATRTAVRALETAGAEIVTALGMEPDGTNINAGCGSTEPAPLAQAVVANKADLGVAFDGDADRLIAVDCAGNVVDGDRLLALFALDAKAAGRLAADTVVVTVMTNLGFHQAMAGAGITVHSTPVGDRHILAALEANRWSLGGEQSGHLIFRDHASTGDGVLSALKLMDLMARSGKPLADLAASVMTSVPQVLINVGVADRDRLNESEAIWSRVRAAEERLGDSGRVLLRPSGTEQLVRVMVEASDPVVAQETANKLAAVVAEALG